MRTRSTFALAFAVVCAAAVPARSEPSPATPDEDLIGWAASIQRQVPAEELESATAEAQVTAQTAGGSDPLQALAERHRLEAPAWLARRVREQGRTATLVALGDSVSVASFSCPDLYCLSNSWSVGDMETSVRRRLEAQSGRAVQGLTAAIPGVTMDALPAEAFAVYLASVLGLNVERMTLLIGHNDPGVCRPDKPGEQERFVKNFGVALNILERVARRRGAKLFVSGMMEVDALTRYADVVPLGASSSCRELWASTGRCADLLQRRGDAPHLDAVRRRIAENNEVLRRLSAGRDWIFYSDVFNAAGRGGLPDPDVNMSRYDCFHPSPAGQSRLGRAAWDGGGGVPGISGFFALEPDAPRASGLVSSELRLQAGLREELSAWARETASVEGVP
jgi:hypothetical protein